MKRGLIIAAIFGAIAKDVYAAEFNFGVTRSPAGQNFTLILLLILIVIITFYIIYRITKKTRKPIRGKNSR